MSDHTHDTTSNQILEDVISNTRHRASTKVRKPGRISEATHSLLAYAVPHAPRVDRPPPARRLMQILGNLPKRWGTPEIVDIVSRIQNGRVPTAEDVERLRVVARQAEFLASMASDLIAGAQIEAEKPKNG